MSRQSRKNRVFAGQMGLDLQFISAATTKAMIDAAAIEVAEKDVTYASLEAAIDSLKLPKTDPGIGFDLKIHDTDKKLDLNKLGDPTKKVIVKSWGPAKRLFFRRLAVEKGKKWWREVQTPPLSLPPASL